MPASTGKAKLPAPADHLGQRAVGGIVWSVGAGILVQGGTFLTAVVLARILGRHEFGRFAMIQSTVLGLTALASAGLGITATKYVSQYRNTQPELTGRILGLSSAVAITAAACFCSVLLLFGSSLSTGGISAADLRLGAIYVLFTTLSGYQVGALAGFEAFRRIARIGVLYGPATVLLHGLLAWWLGIRGAVLAQGASALVLWLLCHAALAAEGRSQGITIQYRGAWRERGALVRFSVPATVSGIAGSLAIWWCNTLLVRAGGYAALGVFTAASTLRLMILFVPALNMRVTSPLLNNLLAGGDVLGYRRAFWGAILCNGGIAVLMAVFLSMAGPQVIRLFGREFGAPPALVGLLLGAAVIEVVAANLYQAVFAGRSMWWHAAIMAVWVGVLLSVSIRAIPGYGAAGLAFAYLAAWCITAVLYGTMAPFGRRTTLRSPAITLNSTAI
jgi:O-antigen/teichoic acid export membrane protein